MIFAARYSGDALEYVIYLFMTLVAVCIALVLHEVAHGLVAKWNGDYTAKYSGRLSLNPLRHFDLFGFIMMMLVGFGYAKPVPVNPYNFKRRRLGQITVALAGVVMNLIVAFFSMLLFCLMTLAFNRSVLNGAGAGTLNLCMYLRNFFEISASINLSLLFFNILPIFPLDGFRVVEAFTKRGNRFCAFMRTNGQYILFGLVGLSFIVSMAFNYVELPYWFEYIDVLGTYLKFFVVRVEWLFAQFWGLMVPIV